jgi:hypothetical protein
VRLALLLDCLVDQANGPSLELGGMPWPGLGLTALLSLLLLCHDSMVLHKWKSPSKCLANSSQATGLTETW